MSAQAAAKLPPPPPDTTPSPEDDRNLTLREHLIELRKRLKWALIWTAAGFIACYSWSTEIFHFLMKPVLNALPAENRVLNFASSTEPFFVYLKVAAYGGLFVASPLILYQVWAFIAPGLYRKERRAVLPFVFAATFFFLAGATFCYKIILPPAFQFLIDSAGPDMRPMLMMDDQLGLVMSLMLAFAIVFELPLVLTFLSMVGLVDYKFLSKYRRHAIVVNVIIAAVVTPTGDPFNLALMAVPMMACYELGVLGAWIFGQKDKPSRFTV